MERSYVEIGWSIEAVRSFSGPKEQPIEIGRLLASGDCMICHLQRVKTQLLIFFTAPQMASHPSSAATFFDAQRRNVQRC